MTHEEAIKEIREASDAEVRYGDMEHHYDDVMRRIEAFDMAIKALGSWDKYSSELWKKAYDRGFKDGVRDGIQAME